MQPQHMTFYMHKTHTSTSVITMQMLVLFDT